MPHRPRLCHLAVSPDLRVVGAQSQHAKQQNRNDNDDKEEGLSPLGTCSSEAGRMTIHVIQRSFFLRHTSASLERL